MKNNLMIASPNEERILSLKQGLNGSFNSAVITDKLHIVWDEVAQTEPEIILLDFDLLGFKSPKDVDRLNRLCTRTRVVILSGEISEDMEWALVKAGVRGCCQYEISSELLRQVVMAVQEGELWVRRAVTSRLLDELGNLSSINTTYQASYDLLNRLTEREYNIAMHVANGQSNKKIAQSCAISERTVKAHLSEIFQKLGISDRVNLALIIASNDSHLRGGESQFH